eukprot:TRINITY_DN1558_c0_g1_i3.p1 TRINITY_DN1558_c0_g1~~TRINITY_DN1558_c0_g1_i3.p1  ORF type:complete len:367 (+),score=90.47 TRINITY_DN1558_c0_g1_i3:162-1103(+)
MSSYFGYVWSDDDYYTVSGGDRRLMIMETTNGICDASLYSLINYKSMLTWQRSWIANAMAKNGQEWTEVFKQFNSGAYNNQYMIIDATKFKPGDATLQAGLFWVLEQMPEFIIAKDMTSYLQEHQAWPSYNRPFFPEMFERMGYPQSVAKWGDYYSHDHTTRANIFREQMPKIKDLSSMKWIMTYNDWQHDPFSLNNSYLAIAARGDLVIGKPAIPDIRWDLEGAIDVKLIDWHMLMNNNNNNNQYNNNNNNNNNNNQASNNNNNNGPRTLALSGPTYAQQSIFSWTGSLSTYSHVGHPESFHFEWAEFEYIE